MLKDSEKEFLSLIRDLIASPVFCINTFSSVIETIRHCVSEHLWSLVMEAGLLDELTNLKAIFLLGRGELYQAFIHTATPRLNHSIIIRSSYVHSLLKAAGRQVLLDDILEKFSMYLQVADSSIGSTEDRSNVWNNLRIHYNAKWPLHKLFGQSQQEKYNKVFVFLLNVRRAQYRLQNLWLVQMQTKKIGSSKAMTLLWTIRHHMTLLIDNLQYYLQVDVLESQYWQLISEISKTRDYQHLATAHHNFLISLHTQCFLNHPFIYATLSSLLTQVHDFCQFMETGVKWDQLHMLSTESFLKKVNKINEDFDGVSRRLFDILSSLKQMQGTQYTSQLVMRIDFNKYYSINKSNMKFLSPLEQQQ